MAITLLTRLGYDERARELEELLDPWFSDMADSGCARYEHFEALASFASAARWGPGLTGSERQALCDVCWMSVAAQRKSFLGTKPDARLTEVRERFETFHQRKPTPLCRRLRRQARAVFKNRATAATREAHALRKHLHDRDGAITTSQVHMRTHRLRRAGRLPPNSKPIAYRPANSPRPDNSEPAR